MIGNFQAKVVTSGVSTTTNGKSSIAVVVRCFPNGIDKPEGSFDRTWNGWLTEKTEDRTFDSLEVMGYLFETDDMSDLAEGKGFDKKAVFEVVIEEEEYEGKKREKIQWVNPIGGVASKFMVAKEEAVTVLKGLNIEGRVANFRNRKGKTKPASTATANAEAATITPDEIPF